MMQTHVLTRVDTHRRRPRARKRSEALGAIIPVSASGPALSFSALIVNGFQLRLTGVNMIACCLPFLASLRESQLCMSSGG